jgi:glyoxylase-like metal-dependent hydrolase (beta-lactamase superfamily II)
MAIQRIQENLFLVDLDLPIPNYPRFMGTWIIREGSRALAIDPGPSVTIPALQRALQELGIKELEYVLLTHIHLDHAGGCGDLIKSHSETRIICHPRAVYHLVHPIKLWNSSVHVHGDMARLWGKPSPIKRQKILTPDSISWGNHKIRVLETPGHASHHLCFFLEDLVFAGDAAGIMLNMNNKTYSRPAAPPPFMPHIALNSIDLMAQKNPHFICYGHYGLLDNAVGMLRRAQEQIRLWLTVIKEMQDKNHKLDEESVFSEILTRDPYMNIFAELNPDIRKKESHSIRLNIRGFVDFAEGSNP